MGTLERVGVQVCDFCGEERECCEAHSPQVCFRCYEDGVRHGNEVPASEIPEFVREAWGSDSYGRVRS